MWDMTAAESAQPASSRVPQWTFADRIRKIRTDVLDLHQHEMATQLGVTKAAYAAWESGRTQPRDILAVARRVELATRVPAAWLLGVDQITGVITPEYVPAHRPGRPPLSLVPAPQSGYRDDDPMYGSCPPASGYDGSPSADVSSGTVNNADAA
jgi:DNA-binding XRE family transcriptional regulator